MLDSCFGSTLFPLNCNTSPAPRAMTKTATRAAIMYLPGIHLCTTISLFCEHLTLSQHLFCLFFDHFLYLTLKQLQHEWKCDIDVEFVIPHLKLTGDML